MIYVLSYITRNHSLLPNKVNDPESDRLYDTIK